MNENEFQFSLNAEPQRRAQLEELAHRSSGIARPEKLEPIALTDQTLQEKVDEEASGGTQTQQNRKRKRNLVTDNDNLPKTQEPDSAILSERVKAQLESRRNFMNSEKKRRLNNQSKASDSNLSDDEDSDDETASDSDETDQSTVDKIVRASSKKSLLGALRTLSSTMTSEAGAESDKSLQTQSAWPDSNASATVSDQHLRSVRFSQTRMAKSLRVTHLWAEDGPLGESRYFWPPCNPHRNDLSLVRIDWIIDYLNNMFLIDTRPTTLDRYSKLLEFGEAAQQFRNELEDGISAEEDFVFDADEVELVDHHYYFDDSVFCEHMDRQLKIRREKYQLASHIDEVLVPLEIEAGLAGKSHSKQNKKRKQKPATNLSSSSVQSSKRQKTFDSSGLPSVIDDRIVLQNASAVLNIPSAFKAMHLSRYECLHPHKMSPLHQRLLIGQLNGFEMHHSDAELTEGDIVAAARKVFGLCDKKPMEWSPEYIESMAVQMAAYNSALIYRLRQKESELQVIYGGERAYNILQNVYYTRIVAINWQLRQMHRLLLTLAACFNGKFKPNIPEHPTMLSSSVVDPALTDPAEFENMNASQRCFRRLLHDCQHNCYRRSGKSIYKQVLSPDGKQTHAYEKMCSIKDYVYTLPSMDFNLQEWLLTTRNLNTQKQLVTMFENMNVPDYLPDLLRQQWVWSFRNGIYDGQLDKFWPYDSDAIHSDPDSPYGRKECSAQYIDKDFDVDKLMSQEAMQDPCSIDVEAFDVILDYQQLCSLTKLWFYGFIGRLFFPVKMMDNWDVVFWIRGVAGTGKSSISHAMQAVYNVADIGIISNNIEVPFGISALVDRFLNVGGEIKHDFKMTESDFQCMAAGDEMALAVKNNDPIMVPHWTVPTLFLSNELPRWGDSQGAIQRRLMQIIFGVVVPDDEKDSTLQARLKDQVVQLIVRACRSYLKIRKQVGKHSVWDKVPEAFRQAREHVRRETSALGAFLEEVLVVDDEQRAKGRSSSDHAVYVDDLRLLYSLKYPDFGSNQRSSRFGTILRRDLPSFYHLKLEVKDEVSKAQIVRGCRLHLPVARKITRQEEWLPAESSYIDRDEILAAQAVPDILDMDDEIEQLIQQADAVVTDKAETRQKGDTDLVHKEKMDVENPISCIDFESIEQMNNEKCQ